MYDKKFSLPYDDRLKVLISINSFIHSRNKKLKYCYNPMLIAEAQKANIWSMKQWVNNVMKDNSDKAISLDVYFLGGFPIDKVDNEDVYTVTWVGATESTSDTTTYAMTFNKFKDMFGEDFFVSIAKTRKDTFCAMCIVFTEKEKTPVETTDITNE